MKKVIIRKPCYENLENMPHVAGGIWCTKCGEKVVDVTKMNAEELENWMKDNSAHKPCGMYTDEQATIPLFKKMMKPIGIAAATVSAMFPSKEIHAVPVPDNSSGNLELNDVTAPDSTCVVIMGRVVSQKSGAGLNDVAIYVTHKDSDITVVYTEFNGNFRIVVPNADSTYTISFSKKSYRTETFERYVPCGETFDVKMKKMSFKQKRRMRHRTVRSKF